MTVLRPPEPAAFAHQGLLYDSTSQLLDAVVPFFRDGARDGDAMILVAAPERLDVVGDALGDVVDHVTLAPATEVYAGGTGHAMASYQRLLNENAQAGRQVRAIAEQPLTGLPEHHLAELWVVDAAFNEVCRYPGASVVCLYDATVVPAFVADMVRRSHPEIIEGNNRRASRQYTDPAILLARDRHGASLPEPAGATTVEGPHDPARVRNLVARTARDAGLDRAAHDDFVTAVNEVVTNACKYARIANIRTWVEDRYLVCEVRDHGPGPIDVFAGYRPPQPDATGGLGLWLARQLTDLMEVRTASDGTTIRLHTALEAADRAS